MRAERHLAIILLLVFAPTVLAAMPYSADWLQYSPERIVYEIDTSQISDNSANIYVKVTIPQSTMQEYIDKWSDFCDPTNTYPWFRPAFAYASTNNQTERMLKIVSESNSVSFTVGNCGTVNIPLTYVVELPNGVLDGANLYGNYQHYIYAYFKYPYVFDFETMQATGMLPQTLRDTSAYGSDFDPTFGKGGALVMHPAGELLMDFNTYFDATTQPMYVCAYVGPLDGENGYQRFYMKYNNDKTVLIGTPGNQFSCAYLSEGLSGSIYVNSMGLDMRCGWYNCGGAQDIYWLWIIPGDLYNRILGR
jgi:hypothetical protein